MKKVIFALGAVGILSGCSSTEIDENHSGIMKVEPMAQIINESSELEKIDVGNLEVPEWFLSVPEDTETKIYAVGTGFSDDLQFSFDKAIHEAKVSLGDKIASKSSSELKTYIADNGRGGQGQTTRKAERVSKSGFKNVDVSKYVVEHRAVSEDRRMFRTYVQVSINPQNRFVDDQINVYNPQDEIIAREAMDSL